MALAKRIILIMLLGGLFFIILNSGIVWFNMPSKKNYPVMGVDVSAHQGNIDWNILSKQNVSFAFIKATEGSGWVDKKFAYNFTYSMKYGLIVGAYHFFSFDSSGESQAKHFIANVPKYVTMNTCVLPPVVDLEFYGDKYSNPPSAESIYKELRTFLILLEQHYKKKPIIYTTPSFYKAYLHTRHLEYPLWIRSVFFSPDSILAKVFDVYFDKTQWTFWQYNPKGVLEGYEKGEKFIDLNVYNGSYADFKRQFCNSHDGKDSNVI